MRSDETWERVKQTLAIGTRVQCRVKEHHPFGVLAAINDVPFAAVIQITDFKDSGRMTPSEYPPLNSDIEAVVLGFKEHGKQVWLGVKPSQLARSDGRESVSENREVVPVGLRIAKDRGLEFFGIEEVNYRIEHGAKVLAIEGGKAIMLKVSEDTIENKVSLRLGGFSVNVIIETPT